MVKYIKMLKGPTPLFIGFLQATGLVMYIILLLFIMSAIIPALLILGRPGVLYS